MAKIQYIEKRFRRDSLLRIQQANAIIEEYQGQGFDLTLRQLYYQFVSRDLIPNNQKSYDNLGSLISDARLAGLVDWDTIEDRTRNLRGNPHWDSPQSIVDACARQFRIDKWENQPYRPEVWIEKDALVGVIEGVCTRLDVPYFSCRGYTSQSEMWRAGQRMLIHLQNHQTPVVFHLGDHDPSGIDMTRDIRTRLMLFTGEEITVERIALNYDQIKQYAPPPNPAKLTDSRAESYIERFGYESWELDALEPSVIVGLIEQHIQAVVDERRWDVACQEEALSRDQLKTASNRWSDVVEVLSGRKKPL